MADGKEFIGSKVSKNPIRQEILYIIIIFLIGVFSYTMGKQHRMYEVLKSRDIISQYKNKVKLTQKILLGLNMPQNIINNFNSLGWNLPNKKSVAKKDTSKNGGQ